MGDPTLVALHLTFFGTLAVAFVMFLGLFVVFVATLVFAGLGRLVAMALMGVAELFGFSPSWEEEEEPPRPARPAAAARPAKKHPALSPDWTAAVALAKARAAAKTAEGTAPAVKVSVRDLPSPAVPVRDLEEVSALVASATDRNGKAAAPRAFDKRPQPDAASVLDTGSRPCVPGRTPPSSGRPQVTIKPLTKDKAQAPGR